MISLPRILIILFACTLDVCIIEFYIATRKKQAFHLTFKSLIEILFLFLFTVCQPTLLYVNYALIIVIFYELFKNKIGTLSYIFVSSLGLGLFEFVLRMATILLIEWLFGLNLIYVKTQLFYLDILLYVIILRFLIFTLVTVYLSHLKYKVNYNYLKFMLVFVVINYAIIVYRFNHQIFYFKYVGRIFYFTTIILVAVTLLTIIFQSYQEKQKTTLEATRQALILEKQYMGEVYSMAQETRRIRHDINNTYSIMLGYIDSGHYDDCRRYLEAHLDEVQCLKEIIYFGEPTIDTVIHSKMKRIKENEITFQKRSGIINFGMIELSDLAMIIGTALDNAIDALSIITQGTKDLSIYMVTINNFLYISITNNVFQPELVQFTHTSKDDSMNHGFGIKKIKQLVKYYDGKMEYKVNKIDSCVTLDILINNQIKRNS